MESRFGSRTGNFRDWPVERTAEELSRLGYACIEICLERDDVRPEQLTERRCKEIKKRLDEIGIGIASLSNHADGEPVRTRRENQFRAVQVAPWMGAGILVLNTESSVDQERQWAEHVDRFGRLSELAESLGVTIAIEPEPLLVVSSSQDMVAMMDAVGSPALKVNLDIGHAQITDEDLVASIRQLGASVVHLHVEDVKDKIHRHLPLGDGDIDLVKVRGALNEIGYSGPCVVDLFGPGLEPMPTAKLALAGLYRYFGP